jgi:hypothetical protein
VKKSTYDAISLALSKVARDITDVFMQVLGTECDILRVSRVFSDNIGNVTTTYQTEIMENVILSHPLGGNIKFFATQDGSYDIAADGIDLYDLLPFTLRVPFSGIYTETPIGVKKGDILVYILLDHQQTKIPIIFEVTRLLGGFMQKNMLKRTYELALVRETLPTEVTTIINAYVAAFVP